MNGIELLNRVSRLRGRNAASHATLFVLLTVGVVFIALEGYINDSFLLLIAPLRFYK